MGFEAHEMKVHTISFNYICKHTPNTCPENEDFFIRGRKLVHAEQ